MKYVTGIHALNLESGLDTTGDWHTSALQWINPTINDTESAFFKQWGIEDGVIPTEDGKLIPTKKADHLRAILDILANETNTPINTIKGFKKNFICTDKYDNLFMLKVVELRGRPNWKSVHDIMVREFGRKWLTLMTGEHSTD